MKGLRLFDDIIRTDSRPRREAEPSYAYYNTSARPGVAAIRGLVRPAVERAKLEGYEQGLAAGSDERSAN
jgi:hypothetical protein